jgi:phage shock protein PspC (stress-responsive transcriptional regulator)
MKKTLTANISGTVFHIEEDAYDRLHRYLNTIRSQFTGTDGREEIMADIESRIAELFTERLDGRRQVVSIDDVEHVIGIMGQPEDYMMGEGAANEQRNAGGERSDKGPNWTMGDAGRRSGKRLFRDPEDKWVGGVLGGVGAYFNIDPLILRLIYLVFLFLGFGIILYLILWIVVPKADSAADMLQMRGEPVTVDNIKRMFEEGAERFQQGARTVASEAEELGKRWSDPGKQPWNSNAGRDIEAGIKRLFTVIGKVVGVAFLVVGSIITVALLGALIGGGTITYDNLTGLGTTSLFDLGAVVFDHSSQAIWFIASLLLLAIIPAIGLLIGGLRLVTGAKTPQWVGWMLSIGWTAALIVALIIGSKVGNDFSSDQTTTDEVPLMQPAGETLFLDIHDMRGNGGDWSVKYDDGRVDWDMDGLKLTADSIHGAWAGLDVVQSPDSLYHLVVERRANGRTDKMALARASHTAFTYLQEDSLVRFSPWVDMPKADKLRAQSVKFVVQVPVGKAVHFKGGTGLLLDDVDNVSNTWDEEMVGRTWTMTRFGLNDKVGPEEVHNEVIAPADVPDAAAQPPAEAPEPPPAVDVRTTATLPNLLDMLTPRS